MCVDADSPIQTLAGFAALVNVVAAVLALEAWWARAVVVVVPVCAAGTVGTWAGGAGIDQRAVLTSEAPLAHAGELRNTVGHLAFAGGSIKARGTVAWVQVLTQWSNIPWPTHAS